ncbi:MAG: DUF4388 domain-containing protein [Planctomycetota bacterium]|mgnify:CR=1 FL=1
MTGIEIRILVIDPEANSTLLLLKTLTSWGYAGYSVTSGEEALKTILEYEPNLILLSNELIGLGAKIVLRWVRTRFPKLPVLVMSPNAEVKEVVEMMKAGATDYLAKPMDLSELKSTIEAYLREADSMEIQGNLELQSVSEIFQIFEQSKKSGVLNMSRGFQQGHITVYQGQVIGGSLGKIDGLKALLRMICWQQGFFNFSEQPVRENRQISQNTEELLFESMRYFDDMNTLLPQLPPLDVPLSIHVLPENEITEEERQLLQKHRRGQRITLQRFMDESPLEDREVLKICKSLREKNCIKLAAEGLGSETAYLTIQPLFTEEEMEYLNKLHQYRGIDSKEFKICVFSTSKKMAEDFLIRMKCYLYDVPEMDYALEGKVRLNADTALLFKVLFFTESTKVLWKNFNEQCYGFICLLDSLEPPQKNWFLQSRAVHMSNVLLPVLCLVNNQQLQLMASITGIFPKHVTYQTLNTELEHYVRKIFLETQY